MNFEARYVFRSMRSPASDRFFAASGASSTTVRSHSVAASICSHAFFAFLGVEDLHAAVEKAHQEAGGFIKLRQNRPAIVNRTASGSAGCTWRSAIPSIGSPGRRDR